MKLLRSRSPQTTFAVAVSLLFASQISNSVHAQNVRQFSPISTPAALPENAEAVEQTESVPRTEIDKSVGDFAEDWSRKRMGTHMAEGFQQRERYLESMQQNVPRDAQMQVESTQNISTLGQYVQTLPDGRRQRVSTVSATVNTRLLVNDPTSGFVAVPGQNELLLEVVEVLD